MESRPLPVTHALNTTASRCRGALEERSLLEALGRKIDRLTLQVERLGRHMNDAPSHLLSPELHEKRTALERAVGQLRDESARFAAVETQEYRLMRLRETDRMIAALDAGVARTWHALDLRVPPRMRTRKGIDHGQS